MKSGAHTQRERLLALLLSARGAWIPLPEILALHIAQYGARIKELRALGFCIENRREHVDGVLHTYFRLNGGVAVATAELPAAEPDRREQARGWIAAGRAETKPVSGSLFPDLARGRYPD